MRKQWLLLVVLLLSFGTLSFACAPQEMVPTEIKPVRVEVDGIYLLFGGQESVVHTPVLIITNPNDFEVTLETLGCEVWVGEEIIGGPQVVYPVYIPPGAEIKLTLSYTCAVSGFIGAKMLGGMGQAAAVGASMPLWKKIGGQNIGLPAEMWDGLPSEVEYGVEGTAIISGWGMRTSTEYSVMVSQ